MSNPNIKDYAAMGGRAKKGVKHKFPSALKDKVLHACAHLEAQGKDLATEAEKNPPWFYENFVKPMLPKEINVLGEVGLQITINKVKSGSDPK